MAGADDENTAGHSEDQEEEKDTETGSGQPAAAAESDQGEYQQPKKRRQVKRRCQIDWLDQSTLSPSTPKNFMTIEELENERKAKRKEQQVITKATKACLLYTSDAADE